MLVVHYSILYRSIRIMMVMRMSISDAEEVVRMVKSEVTRTD